jgi:hypothetical protein
MKNIVKIIIAVAAFGVLLINAAPAKADSMEVSNMPDLNQIASDMMEQMGMNPTSMKDMFEQMNVATNKKEVPSASVTFTPSDPKEGDDVNAMARFTGFKNPKEGLYFTWFIKHDAKCPKDDGASNNSSLCGYKSTASKPYSDSDARKCDKGNCDWDEDGDITLNDYKIEAIRQIAAKKFDSDFPDESYYTNAQTAQGADNHDDDDDGYTAIYGGEKSQQTDSSTAQDTIKMCYIHDYKSGNDYQIVDEVGDPITLDPDNPVPSHCFHLFPKDRGGDVVGDGDYGKDQERLFGTDHHRADTLGLGEKDGAAVTGLGLDKITWKYQQGDKAGVVVEGTSMIPNKYHSSSMQIMWTFPEIEDCKIDNLTNETSPPPDMPLPQDPLSSMTKDKLMVNVATISEEGIDNCLEKSMKEVMSAGPELLDVTLTPTPDSPMMEDTIKVTSSVSNSSNDAAQMKYEWVIDGGNKTNGDDISAADMNEALNISGSLTGNGLQSISFKLKPPPKPGDPPNGHIDDVKSIKIKVTISENYDASGEIQRGKGSVTIPINSSGDRIEVYQVNIVGKGSDKVKLSLGPKICNEGDELAVCPVLQNQIVGVKTENASGVSNFLWTLDGKAINCDSSMSSDCSDAHNINFFPIAGSVGQKYSLLLTANSVGTSSNDLNLTRIFQVVNPSVKISADGTSAWPKYLGEYTPLNSQDCVDTNDHTKDLCADYSQSVFETGAGNSVTLNSEFTPKWIGDPDPAYAANLKKEWTIDGEIKDKPAFTAGEIGAVHSASINATYTPSEDTRWALEKFGISEYSSTEQNFSDSVQTEVVEGAATAAAGTKKFIASLLSNLPEQVFFLLRIMLSIFVILLVSNIVFIFSPVREADD